MILSVLVIYSCGTTPDILVVSDHPLFSSLWVGNWGWAPLSHSSGLCWAPSNLYNQLQVSKAALPRGFGCWVTGLIWVLCLSSTSLGLFVWWKQCSERERERQHKPCWNIGSKPAHHHLAVFNWPKQVSQTKPRFKGWEWTPSLDGKRHKVSREGG